MSSDTFPPAGDPSRSPDDIPPIPPAEPLGYQPAGALAETDPSAKTMGMLCHLLSLCGLVGIPFGNIIGPLVIWLIKKDQYPFVNDQGKESLNFQITSTIAAIIAGLLIFLLIGFLLLPVVLIAWLVLTIMATIAASNGTYYRYPFNLRLIK